MKIKNIKNVLFVGLSLLSVMSCSKTLDINNTPNYPPVANASPKILFPFAVMSSAARIGGEYALIGGVWSQFWTQSASSSQYKSWEQYAIDNNTCNGSYTELFSGALMDCNKIQELATNSGDWNANLMATVIKGYTFQVLADLYDQVPYNEAFLGSDNLQPHFQDGYTIYTQILAELDNALAKDFTAKTNTDLAETDLVFEGDIDSWKKFANTLKLKMYLRMVNAKPDEAKAGIQKLYADGAAFLDVDAQVASFTNTLNYQNPMYGYNVANLNTTTNLRASSTMFTWLQKNNDPRLTDYYAPASASVTTLSAMPQGDFTAPASQYARVSIAKQSPTDPVQFISLAESYFMQAEARVRYFNGDNAGALYNEGMVAAFDQVKRDASAFIAADSVYAFPDAGTQDQKIEAIIVQKWASFPGSHALEAFFEKNRTGYPKTSEVYSGNANGSIAPGYIPGQIVYSKNGVTAGAFPKRLLFPKSEVTRNNNTPAQVPLTTKVWWAL